MSGWVTSSKSKLEAGRWVVKIAWRFPVTFGNRFSKVKPNIFSKVFLKETSQSNSQILEGGIAPNSSQFQAKAASAAEVSFLIDPYGFP